jgi:hypothetical protein
MDARHARAEVLVTDGKVSRGHDCFVVRSQSGSNKYRVVLDGLFPSCTCADFELVRPQMCKHMQAAQLWLDMQARGEFTPRLKRSASDTPDVKRKSYPQDWPNYNLAATREKDHVQDLLANLTSGLPGAAPKAGTKGGRPAVPLADQAFAAVFKVYCGTSARRFVCDLRSAAERGHMSAPLCHNSVLKALESEALTPILKDLIRVSALPLKEVETKWAVDSTGFATLRYARWYDKRYGVTREEAEWVKAHLCTGTFTNVVSAVDILDQDAADSPQFPGLVSATAAAGFKVDEVSADKAYAGSDNFNAVDAAGGVFYPSFKSNTTGAVGGLFEKAFHYFCLNRDEYLRHYHARSNVESTISMVKRKHGELVRSRTDTAMKNEVYAKFVAHNLCCLVSAIYELGIVPVFWREDEGEPSVIRFPTVV